jgi:7,8-dihydropterin-6-yl-methyl-4-(beta-D-ribofuranosyl)aminobenzene 5'-phosphate synthase
MRIPLEPVDAVTISTIMDNSSDMLLENDGPAIRGRTGANVPQLAARFVENGKAADALLAEHGFCALLTVRKGDTSRRVLFDAGMTPNGAAENMRRLELPLKDVEAIVLSHGHFDHTTGMHGITDALGTANLPVYIHPEFWSRRRIAIPGREPREVPTTSKQALLGAGFEVIEERQPSFLLDGSVLITGEVDRTTEFEKGFPVHEAFHQDHWQPDPLILDDQAAILHVRGKGLVVLTGCGHAGIVNIVRYAQKLTGVDNVYAVIGGFHLGGPIFEPIIPDTVAALRALNPAVVVPAHCTGWRAQHAIAAAMPGAFIQNSVGTRYEL